VTPWEKVVAATEGHNIDEFSAHMGENGQAWTYIRCTCYPTSETFREPWEFTDHIRRIVYETTMSAVGSAVGEPPTE
jgi:hypothetical protein